jgi:DNA-binding NtrC family response regulator
MARVLLAEDDATMLDMVKHALAADGHTVVTAQDGQEALEILSAAGASFDVMLTDIQMPSVNGLELTGKAIALLPQLRVVLMSAFAENVSLSDAVKPHVRRVLSKPLALDQVKAAVREAAAG